jgi:hypothetical protein
MRAQFAAASRSGAPLRGGVTLLLVLLVLLVLGTGLLSTSQALAAWSIVPSPNVPGAAENSLRGISCISSTACVAVGYSGAGTSPEPLAELWNGSEWALSTPPKPTGAASAVLNSVSCKSTTCTAVGYYTVSSGETLTLAEQWNGSGWSIQSTPNVSGGESQPDTHLTGVYCTGAKACVAVGGAKSKEVEAGYVPVAERWNGKEWTLQPLSGPSTTGPTVIGLLGVSCSSGKACTAIGDTFNGTVGGVSFAERWNGSAWSLQEISNPPEQQFSDLGGVSCASATMCNAVGSSKKELLSLGKSLAELWNGSAWSRQTTAGAPGEANSDLLGVSCATAKACTAVGEYGEGGFLSSRTLVNNWTPAGWSFEESPNPSGSGRSQLLGVYCESASECTAVGRHVNAEGTESTTLIETK